MIIDNNLKYNQVKATEIIFSFCFSLSLCNKVCIFLLETFVIPTNNVTST